MPKVAYSEEERERIRDALVATGLELFARQGIQHTTVEQIYTRVGISRTFFYSFFPAKEDLVVQAFYHQQPQMLAYVRRLMEDAGLSWRERVEQFLRSICYGGRDRFAIMSVEEQQALSKCLSGEKGREFQERRLAFFAEILHTFGLDLGTQTVKLLANLIFSAAILHKALPDTLPFLFPDAADEMTVFQIETMLDYMEALHTQENS